MNFKTDRFPDLYQLILERARAATTSTWVLAKKICDGLIRVKSDAAPVTYTKNGVGV
jgi:hypothetical protein